MSECPLCKNSKTALHFEEKNRNYYFCEICYLIFVPEKFHCTSHEEKKRYDHHQNFPNSKGYLDYEKWMSEFLLWSCPQALQGNILDYGCGPYPLLHHLLKTQELECENYDLYFFPNNQIMPQSYDNIFASEVIEHFRHPFEDWKKMLCFLKKGGSLFLRTSLWDHRVDWINWSYRRDLTHVTFYHEKTFLYLSHTMGLTLKRIANDKIEMQKIKR